MTDEELAEMERRAEAWSGRFEEDVDGDLAICPGGQDAYVCPVSEVDGGVAEVAAMLNNLPALLAEVRRLRGELARVVAWLRGRGTIEGDEYADAIEAGEHDKGAT